ncbi:proenkephalin-A-like isoform X1 [Melanotaenia boesemani]|uniref:proenkephalin-A-like isoform X1 n=1 Tax=Melanotaenia boesemani TaxID=1250792 RepID=UPI001C052AC6|nr:proenkephalin-A-like isoform X1 [Melanotaenia boesemani]
MASRAQRSCLWMLILGACVSLVVGAECGKECALCLYHARGHQSALACSLECQGVLDSQRLRLCQDFLFEEENGLSLDADPSPQQDQEAVGAMTHDDGAEQSPEHLMAKKYGGFIKRYGGFMSRRSSSPEETLDDLENQDEEENIRLEILKIISAAGDHGGEEDSHGGEVVKRYGGFMRRDEGGVAPADLLKAVLDRGLKKRYGGFMRRVGRPEWLVDNNNKNAGMMKRAWENGSGLQKRYGGFMD